MPILKVFFLFLALCWSSVPLTGQWTQAILDAPTATLRTQAVAAPTLGYAGARTDLPQLPGFPVGFAANPNFKNIRNLTLADLDGDGLPEILVGAGNSLYALTASGAILWQRSLSGVAIYPPSVADLDADGDLEVVQATGGVPAAGRVYALDHLGADLPGWPLNLNNNWILTAPTLVDVDADNQYEIIFCERVSPAGRVHLRRLDASNYGTGWPVTLDATPAVTASAGDVDGDGATEIVVYSTTSRYILGLDGQPTPGFPLVTGPAQRYSYQSPILAPLWANDPSLAVIGATHGDTQAPAPEFYVMHPDGADAPGWPIPTPNQQWTYSTPSVVQLNDQWTIFMSRPIGSDAEEMLYGWQADGQLLPGFPIVKSGGCEGVITLADVDGDQSPELIFGSNLLSPTGQGAIHAYKLDGSGQVAGFPILPRGWTYLNGATPTDLNGDGNLDLVLLSYTLNFGAAPDSILVHAYTLPVPFVPELALWTTYKGHNDRSGQVGDVATGATSPPPSAPVAALRVTTLPEAWLVQGPAATHLAVADAQGRWVYQTRPTGLEWRIPFGQLPAGVYWIIAADASGVLTRQAVVKPH